MAEQVSLQSKVKFLVVAGVGLFSDGFLNLAIGLGQCYHPSSYRASQC